MKNRCDIRLIAIILLLGFSLGRIVGCSALSPVAATQAPAPTPVPAASPATPPPDLASTLSQLSTLNGNAEKTLSAVQNVAGQNSSIASQLTSAQATLSEVNKGLAAAAASAAANAASPQGQQITAAVGAGLAAVPTPYSAYITMGIAILLALERAYSNYQSGGSGSTLASLSSGLTAATGILNTIASTTQATHQVATATLAATTPAAAPVSGPTSLKGWAMHRSRDILEQLLSGTPLERHLQEIQIMGIEATIINGLLAEIATLKAQPEKDAADLSAEQAGLAALNLDANGNPIAAPAIPAPPAPAA
jgi:hypothetical protein